MRHLFGASRDSPALVAFVCLIDEIFGRHSVNFQFDNQSEVLFKIIGSSELAMEIEEDNIWVIWLYNLRINWLSGCGSTDFCVQQCHRWIHGVW